MIRTILLVALLSPYGAMAEDSPCEAIGRMTEDIMTARQNNVPISRLMKVAKDNALLQGIILEAYSAPRFSTERIRKDTIADFRNTVESACYTAISPNQLP